jgi:hypothetical protein
MNQPYDGHGRYLGTLHAAKTRAKKRRNAS